MAPSKLAHFRFRYADFPRLLGGSRAGREVSDKLAQSSESGYQARSSATSMLLDYQTPEIVRQVTKGEEKEPAARALAVDRVSVRARAPTRAVKRCRDAFFFLFRVAAFQTRDALVAIKNELKSVAIEQQYIVLIKYS